MDKAVLITGGGSGIGWGIARALAEAGCRVAIAGRGQQRLNDAIACWEATPAIRAKVADVADRTSVTELVAWANQELGGVDILVNAAGINIPNRSMAEMTPEDWDRVMTINATGAFNTMFAILPQMRERRDGLIINISSVAGKRALQLGGIAYCASKFAMTALGTAVGSEVAEFGIRVTNVYPGEVNTPILENRPTPVSEERKAQMVRPEDIGALIRTIAALPPQAHVPEIVIKPLYQDYI